MGHAERKRKITICYESVNRTPQEEVVLVSVYGKAWWLLEEGVSSSVVIVEKERLVMK